MKPKTVKKWTSDNLLLSAFSISLVLAVASIYLIFWHTPDDYLQGIYFKILYIHVPSAWLSLGLYVCVAGSAALYLIMGNPLYNIIAKACAELGIVFTALTLLTGMVWGKPTWGTWWVWDARLTSMLVLLFIYAGYLGLQANFSNRLRAAKISSIFALVGLVNIPIIKFSVYLWSTLHQKSTFFKMVPSMHSSMMPPLLLNLLSMALLSSCIVGLHIRYEMLRIKHIKNQ